MARGTLQAESLLNWRLERLEPRQLYSSESNIVLVLPAVPADSLAADAGLSHDPASGQQDAWTEWVPQIQVQWDGKFGPEIHTDQHFQGIVSTFTMADATGDISASISWGDGQSSFGAIVSNGDGTFSVTGDHDYANKGQFNPFVTITSADYEARDSVSLLMGATGMTALWEPQAFAPASRDEQEMCIGLFVDPDASDISRYAVTINWGDGTSSPGSIDFDSDGNFYVSGAHAYAQAGSFDVSYTVAKTDGTTLSAHGNALVWDSVPEHGVAWAVYDDALIPARRDGAITIDSAPGR